MLDQLGELVIGWNVSELFSVGVKQQKRASIPFLLLFEHSFCPTNKKIEPYKQWAAGKWHTYRNWSRLMRKNSFLSIRTLSTEKLSLTTPRQFFINLTKGSIIRVSGFHLGLRQCSQVGYTGKLLFVPVQHTVSRSPASSHPKPSNGSNLSYLWCLHAAVYIVTVFEIQYHPAPSLRCPDFTPDDAEPPTASFWATQSQHFYVPAPGCK